MPEPYPPRRSPPRHRPGSPRRRSPSPRGHDYPPRYRDSRRPPSPPGRSYPPRRDDYYRDRDSRYSRYSPDDRRGSDRDRYDDRRRFSDRDRGPLDSRHRDRSPPYRSRRSPPPAPRSRRHSRSRSRSRPRPRSRSRTPPRGESDSFNRPLPPNHPSQRRPELEAGPSRSSPQDSRHTESKETEIGSAHDAPAHSSSHSKPLPTNIKIEERQPGTQPSAERKALALKIEPGESPKEHTLRLPSASTSIPTGPRAHNHPHPHQDSQTTSLHRLPTGPLAERQGAAVVKQEVETPVSASSTKKEGMAPHISIPAIKLYDPVSEEEKIRRQKFREEKKREEARGRELERELDRAMHDYEMTRLDLTGIEKRRALAEAQLEQLNMADIV